jgi:hypothetical protein
LFGGIGLMAARSIRPESGLVMLIGSFVGPNPEDASEYSSPFFYDCVMGASLNGATLRNRCWPSDGAASSLPTRLLGRGGLGDSVRCLDARWRNGMFLDYFALGVLIFVAVTLFYAIIAIHDIPYEIAVHRNHPHQDAIHVAGWVSLFTLHAIWPFLWLWAMLYRPDRGWGMGEQGEATVQPTVALARLEERIAKLEQRLPGGWPEQHGQIEKPESPVVETTSEPIQPVEKI